MSTSGFSTSVTPPPRPLVSIRASASAPGRRGPSTQAPITTAVPTPMAAGRVIPRGRARPSEHGARRLGEPGPEQRRGEHAGGDEGERQHDPVLARADGGDEDEQHAAGHQRLTSGPGAERERVAEQDRERRSDRGEQRPPADVGHGRHRRGELVPHEREVRPGDVPGLRGREHPRERRRIVQPGDDPDEHDGGDPDGNGAVHPALLAQQPRQAVADDHDDQHVADELPVAEDPAEPEGGDEGVQRQRDRRRGVEHPPTIIAGARSLGSRPPRAGCGDRPPGARRRPGRRRTSATTRRGTRHRSARRPPAPPTAAAYSMVKTPSVVRAGSPTRSSAPRAAA